MKIQENRSVKPGNQWEGKEVIEGGAKVKYFVMLQPRSGRCHG